MNEVNRWVSRYSAGTESSRMAQLVKSLGDPDESTPYVLAEDYDQLLAERDALAADLAQMNQLCESLQNRLASRPLTGADTTELEARCDAAELDAANLRNLLESCRPSLVLRDKVQLLEIVDAAIKGK